MKQSWGGRSLFALKPSFRALCARTEEMIQQQCVTRAMGRVGHLCLRIQVEHGRPGRLEMRKCPACSSHRPHETAACKTCAGAGVIRLKRTIRVVVPQGVESGTILKVKGRGNCADGGQSPGDLYIGVIVRPHASIKRKGRHMYSTVDVPLTVALLGGTVTVGTLRGPRLLRIPPCTPHSHLLSLEGHGVGECGAHHFEVKVQLPEDVGKEEVAILEALGGRGCGQ